MDKTTTLDAPAKRDAEYEAAIDRSLHELEKIRDDIDERQQRIEQSQAETKAMLAQIAQLRAA